MTRTATRPTEDVTCTRAPFVDTVILARRTIGAGRSSANVNNQGGMNKARSRVFVSLVVVVLLAAVALVRSAQQSPQTHWEPYKAKPGTTVPDRHLSDPMLIGAIDLHAHHDPDSYPRDLDGFEVAKLARDRGLRGLVLKNHWEETAGLAYLARKYATPGFEVFGAVTLDTAVGGVNPQAVRYMIDIVGSRGRIVWMPTH